MPIKNLPEENSHNNNREKQRSNKEDMRQHMISHEKDQREHRDYQLIISEIKDLKAFEPDPDFTDKVTANLPAKYARKEKSLFEMFSLVMILIPVGIVAGLLMYNRQLEFSYLKRISGAISSSMYSVYNGFASFRLIGDNMDMIGLFIVYAIIFSILNWFFISSEKGKQSRKNQNR